MKRPIADVSQALLFLFVFVCVCICVYNSYAKPQAGSASYAVSDELRGPVAVSLCVGQQLIQRQHLRLFVCISMCFVCICIGKSYVKRVVRRKYSLRCEEGGNPCVSVLVNSWSTASFPGVELENYLTASFVTLQQQQHQLSWPCVCKLLNSFLEYSWFGTHLCGEISEGKQTVLLVDHSWSAHSSSQPKGLWATEWDTEWAIEWNTEWDTEYQTSRLLVTTNAAD